VSYRRRRQAKLTASRLCTESPTAGGRVFETGDEKLLRLAHETESALLPTTPVMRLRHDVFAFMESAPVVIVFTKYDRLVRSKQIELSGDQNSPVTADVVERSKVEAEKVMVDCMHSLESAESRLKTQKLNYAKVSSMISRSFADQC
jgi:GTPase SAR1 family protein